MTKTKSLMIGAWVYARKSNGWSLRDAQKASGVSAAQISRFERDSEITLSTLIKLMACVNMRLVLAYEPPLVKNSNKSDDDH